MTKHTFSTYEFSDLYKDVYGFRPSFDHSFYSSSDNEKQSIWDDLIIDLERNLKEDELWEKRSIREFEGIVAQLIEMGAGDRETAIRWLMQEYSDYDTAGYICWDLDLSYKYEKEIERYRTWRNMK